MSPNSALPCMNGNPVSTRESPSTLKRSIPPVIAPSQSPQRSPVAQPSSHPAAVSCFSSTRLTVRIDSRPASTAQNSATNHQRVPRSQTGSRYPLHLYQFVRVRFRDREAVFFQCLDIELNGLPDERAHLLSGFRGEHAPWQVRHMGAIAGWPFSMTTAYFEISPLSLAPPASRHCATFPEHIDGRIASDNNYPLLVRVLEHPVATACADQSSAVTLYEPDGIPNFWHIPTPLAGRPSLPPPRLAFALRLGAAQGRPRRSLPLSPPWCRRSG